MNSFLKIILFSATGLACASGQIRPQDALQGGAIRNPRVYSIWTVFYHPRFGFELPIPPGVSAVGNPEASNEPRFLSADGRFVMSAWGGLVSDHPSKTIAAEWNSALRQVDRKITYQRLGTTWFVVSGTDVRGMEFYEKFTMRGRHAAFMGITFPRSNLRQYEGWVEEIEDGFRPVALRDGLPEPAQLSSRNRVGAVPEERPAEPKTSEALSDTLPPAKEPTFTEPAPKKPPTAADAPTAGKIAGKPGFVYSPFSSEHRLVDVSGVPSGTKVKCPYTMKIFRVP